MKLYILFSAVIVSVLIIGPAALPGDVGPDEIGALDSPTADLARLIIQERDECSSSSLDLDIRLSSYLERKLPEIVQVKGSLMDCQSLEVNLNHYVPDYDKACFLWTGRSEMQVIDSLLADVTVKRAMEVERYTHIIVASYERLDEAAAVAVFLRRLVHFGLSNMAFTSDGDMSITLTGRAPGCRMIRFTFHKGLDEPGEYSGTEKLSETQAVGHDEHFEVKLPLSIFGSGDYKVSTFVQPEGSVDFVLAATLDVSVPPLNMGGRYDMR